MDSAAAAAVVVDDEDDDVSTNEMKRNGEKKKCSKIPFVTVYRKLGIVLAGVTQMFCMVARKKT
ncbi:hypothetical protein DERF_010158 [Dermatophagoides farinae]|uniref:Uncharacterized protein n=1 Tax=Dermatophagoides farinae TaxID=6954 RepID=A0A922L1Q2_DERFA|nr:hypothetical protein DERF_010158 [Dermatophagoides farinae]